MKTGILVTFMLMHGSAIAAGEASFFVCTTEKYIRNGSNSRVTVDCKIEKDNVECKSYRIGLNELEISDTSYKQYSNENSWESRFTISRLDGRFYWESGPAGYIIREGTCEKKTARIKF